MAIESRYDWNTVPPATQSWIKPWMVIALILSGAVHAGLYIWFQQVVVPREQSPTRAAIENLKDLKVQKVINEELKAKEPESTDATDKAAITQVKSQDIIQQVEDPYELQQALPNVEIRLKPDEDLPPIPGRGDTKEAGDVASILGQDSAELAKKLDRITKRMLDKVPATSPDQLVIRNGVSEDKLLEEEELLKSYNETLAKLSKTGNGITQGFSNLDELLNRVGPIMDATKPILMPTDLLFGYNEEALKESARLSLMKLGLLIQRNPESTFIIEGHTDTTGSNEYNMKLSKQRALSVHDWLSESLSIKSKRIRIKAMGETRPLINPSGTREEQSINRRVEIVILPPERRR
ncbi:MAG: OmpA family protein [Verrucomicrobiaceae bacterium]|nr:OmpA family protein [Verrucomicrobiaceae bacterium]